MTVCIVVNGEQCPMPNVKLIGVQYVKVSSGLNHYFFELSFTQTDTHTDTQTDRHTDGHEYSIVAVDKPQL